MRSLQARIWAARAASSACVTSCFDVLRENARSAIVALSVAVGTAIVFVPSATAQDVLRVGAAPFAAPVTFMDAETENFGGYMVDTVAEFAEMNGFTVEFVPLLVQDLGPSLANGDIDIVAGIIVDVPAVREAFLLSRPIYPFTEGLFVAADDPATYNSIGDLAGKRIAIQIGTYDQLVEGMDLGIEVVPVESILTALAAIDAGEVDAAIVGGPTGAYQLFLGNFPNTQRAESYEPFAVVQGVIAVRMEDTDLMEMINSGIDQLEEDGTLAEIFSRYGAAYTPLD